MSLLIIVVVLLVAFALGLAVLKAKSDDAALPVKRDIYVLKHSLLTPAERSFLGVLERLDYEGIRIAIKVRLADVFEVKKGLARREWQRGLNRISSKHVDFLLIQAGDGRPLVGIELDDSSHAEPKRVARDAFVQSVFASGKLPLLRVAAKVSHDPKEIRRLIDEAIKRGIPPPTMGPP